MKPLKGPFLSSRGESSPGPPQISRGGGGAPKLTTCDALTYLKEVKEMFKDERQKYEMFLDVMRDFRSQRVDTCEVVDRVKELFKGYTNLMYGFNTFLPKGYEITIVEEEEEGPVKFEEAIDFVNKIKRRFQNDHYVYQSFLEILNMYRNEHKVIKEVYREVGVLFIDHPDLLDGFSRFLPKQSATASVQQISRHSLHRYDKQRRRDRIITSNVECNIAVERTDVDDDKTMLKLQKDQRKRVEKESRESRNRDQDHRDSEHESNRDFNMQRVHGKKKSGRTFEDSETNPGVVSLKDRDAVKSTYRQEFIFCEKVKERMHSEDDYQAFLKCLHIYSTKIITKKELQRLVADLLGKYPDLMEGFNGFLERCENIDGFLAGVMSRKYSEASRPKSAKVQENEEQKRETLNVKDNRYDEKYMWKSNQELDLSSCQRCTPSYRLLPEDYPIPSASQRSKLGAQVLNDNWVSVTSGSEDYSFKHMRRNQYEESLFRCEDDRFELDMLLESVSATTKRVEELLNCLNNNTIDLDSPIPLEDYFTAINMRCIERLYGDHGVDVMDVLRKNPSVALPIILTRLKQKLEEWNNCRVDFNKVWAEIYAKNHYKSLDQRSFYFKQQDSKNLNTKVLVAEIKEMKGKTQNPDDAVLAAISAGSRHHIAPNLVFEYSDSEIHEDLYKLIRYSCEEVCTTKEQFNKVIRLWTSFLEPMLGITSRPPSSESIEKAEKARTYTGKAINSSNVEESLSLEKANVGKIKMAKWDTSAKEDTFDPENKSGDERYIDASSSLALLADNFHVGNNEARSNIDDVPSVESGSNLKPVPLKNGLFRENNDDEKEEGELSPNVDFEEDNFAVFGEGGSFAMPKWKQYQADDLGNEKNTEGEHVSGSESANDECSPEEHEEDEEQGEREVEERDGTSPLILENFVRTAKPLAKHLSSTLPGSGKKDSRVFYASDAFYVLFRLHQVLYDRLLSAKLNSTAAEMKQRTAKDTNPSDLYGRFMTALYSLLDGSTDNAKFEDDCREIIGNHSYVLFTLDKLIYKLVKQLQTVSVDETDNKLLQLFEYEKSRTGDKYVDPVYYDNVHVVLHDENIYRVECSSAPFRLSIQLMDDVNDKVEVSVDPKFSAYLHNEFLSIVSSKKDPPSIFLKRNKHKYAGLDESSAICNALDDVHLVNGLECKMACSSSKIAYVLDTEDCFYRMKRRKISSSHDHASIEHFHKFLADAS